MRLFPANAPRLKFRLPGHSEAPGLASAVSVPGALSSHFSKSRHRLLQNLCSNRASWSENRSLTQVNGVLRGIDHWVLINEGALLTDTSRTTVLKTLGVDARPILLAEVSCHGE